MGRRPMSQAQRSARFREKQKQVLERAKAVLASSAERHMLRIAELEAEVARLQAEMDKLKAAPSAREAPAKPQQSMSRDEILNEPVILAAEAVKQAKARMVAVHPDRGGAHEDFVKAQAIHERAVKDLNNAKKHRAQIRADDAATSEKMRRQREARSKAAKASAAAKKAGRA